MTGHQGGFLKDLLRTEDLSREDVDRILDVAAGFAQEPLKSAGALAHKSVAIYMTKPSTRTRLASETAVSHLGGTPIFLRGDELQLGRGETIEDTARIVSQFCSALIIRTYAQNDVDQLGAHSSIPIINALTDEDHPTQLLADWMVIREKFGKDISGRKFVYVGDGNNVANSWLIMGAIMGAHVIATTPSGKFSVAPDVIAKAESIARSNGGRVETTNDVKAAAEGASVIYTDVWMSMGDSESERAEKFNALSPFAVDEKLMALTASDSIFMHCLPAHRGEEVAASVIDGAKSVVWREAFHRRTTIQALLYLLTRRELKGN
jgi:ornithine carbamoyltransferase